MWPLLWHHNPHHKIRHKPRQPTRQQEQKRYHPHNHRVYIEILGYPTANTGDFAVLRRAVETFGHRYSILLIITLGDIVKFDSHCWVATSQFFDRQVVDLVTGYPIMVLRLE